MKKISLQSLIQKIKFYLVFCIEMIIVSQTYSFEETKDKNCFIDFDGQKHCLTSPKNREVCCRLTYPEGGYDFVITNEKNCRASEYFSGFLALDNHVCVRWNGNEKK